MYLLFIFFFTKYENEWKEHNFQRWKDQQNLFLKKKKKLSKINDIATNKILVSKKESYIKKGCLNTSLGIMVMMSVDHYV